MPLAHWAVHQMMRDTTTSKIMPLITTSKIFQNVLKALRNEDKTVVVGGLQAGVALRGFQGLALWLSDWPWHCTSQNPAGQKTFPSVKLVFLPHQMIQDVKFIPITVSFIVCVSKREQCSSTRDEETNKKGFLGCTVHIIRQILPFTKLSFYCFVWNNRKHSKFLQCLLSFDTPEICATCVLMFGIFVFCFQMKCQQYLSCMFFW